MTGQLLKVTTTPFQAVRFSQNARLVSSGSVDLERRKAIARMRAFQSQHSSRANLDMNYVNQINRTFSTKQTHQPTAPAADSTAKPVIDKANTAIRSSSQTSISAPASDNHTADSDFMPVIPSSSQGSSSPEVQANLFAENDSAYTVDRGAFEFRVATGEVSFLPPLTMTVITQRPEVHFEYTGGYHYVPASSFEDGILNLSI
jgi:hypothetical protein